MGDEVALGISIHISAALKTMDSTIILAFSNYFYI
jgi:hypothetical protein